jgi:hypothetical protein
MQKLSKVEDDLCLCLPKLESDLKQLHEEAESSLAELTHSLDRKGLVLGVVLHCFPVFFK